MKLWVLDLGMFSPDDWHHEAIEWSRELHSAQAVAEDCAATWDEDCTDGQIHEVLVAEDSSGKNARRFKMRTRFEVSYDVTKSEDCEIPPPETETAG